MTSYRDQLRGELKRRQVTNSRYSLRAFAKALGLSPAFLSKVLNGTSDLSAERAIAVAEKLGLSPAESAEFRRLVQNEGLPELKDSAEADPREFTALSLDAFQAISDWQHNAILLFTECEGFLPDPSLIGRALGLKRAEASEALARLVRLGLLKKERGTYVRTNAFISTPTDRPSQAIRNFHRQMIEKAKTALDEQTVDERDITGVTLSIDPKRLPEAKDEIRKFRQRMAKFFDSSRPREVYQMNIQFFRLTKKETS